MNTQTQETDLALWMTHALLAPRCCDCGTGPSHMWLGARCASCYVEQMLSVEVTTMHDDEPRYIP